MFACDQVPLPHVACFSRNPPRHRVADVEYDLEPAAICELHVKGGRVALLPDWERLGINLHTGS